MNLEINHMKMSTFRLGEDIGSQTSSVFVSILKNDRMKGSEIEKLSLFADM